MAKCPVTPVCQSNTPKKAMYSLRHLRRSHWPWHEASDFMLPSKHYGPCSSGPGGSRRQELSFWDLHDLICNAGASQHHLPREHGSLALGGSESPRDRSRSFRYHKHFSHWTVFSSWPVSILLGDGSGKKCCRYLYSTKCDSTEAFSVSSPCSGDGNFFSPDPDTV